jgi:hypothetical protein
MSAAQHDREYDLELAVTQRGDDFDEWVRFLPPKYWTEDRCKQGYGFVIRSEASESAAEINLCLTRFLQPLSDLSGLLKARSCMLRVAVFSKTFFTTIVLNSDCYRMLELFDARMELSVYPCADD